MHVDLVVVGSGSGNTILGREFRDQRVALIESGTFGGTCLNVGCIPTKSFVYPADLADAVVRADRLGLMATVAPVDWALLRDRIFTRIDEISAHGLEFRQGATWPNLEMLQGTARFTGFKQMAVALTGGGRVELTADRFVLAAGGRPVIPDIPGLDEDIVGDGVVHTSDTIMRIDERPDRIVVIGGGYIAAEFAHIFDSFGSRVTQIVRGSRLLRHHDDDIAATFTDHVRGRYDLRRDTEICGVKPLGNGIRVFLESPYGETTVDADMLLIATGRRPNSDLLDLPATGVTIDDKRRVIVDEYQETVVPGIYALGDLSSPYALKHVANHEARVVRHNLTHPDDRITTDHRFVPAAVFTEPQIASVGLTEGHARQAGIPFVVGRRDYGNTAAGWAREDTTGFAKVLADPATGLLLGAHLIGPEAAALIQPLVQAMSFGQRAHDVARGQYWIHPALSEVVENALLALPTPTG